MPAGLNNTALLDLPLPVEGYFDGSWGDLVNFSLTNYLDIAIAGTSTFTGDGAVTLDNTAGDDTATNITANSGQYAIIKVAGTLTTTKIITVGTAGSPAVSKSYIVDNAATGGIVTFKAYGQTGISVAVGEKCIVYFNGTDFVKVASSVADGVTSVTGTGTVNGITLTGTVTSTGNLTLGGTLANVNLTSQVTGTLPIANGGTGTTSTTFANLTTNVTGTLPIANGGTGTTSTTFVNLATNVTGTLPVANGGKGITSLGTGVATFLGTPSSANLAAAVSDETGSGSLVFATSPTLAGTPLAPTATTGTNTTQIATTAFVQNSISAIASGVTSFSAGTTGLTPSTGTTGAVTLSGTLAVANGGTGITSFGTGVATFLGTPSSANLAAAVSDETGTGALVFANTPTLVTPILGTPTSGNLANCTFPTLNQNTTGTAASTPKLLTTNFTIEESGGNLIFKYGGTTIASMTSAGVFTTISDITGNGTP